MSELTPETILSAYASGVFPMAESADADSVFWVDPQKRGIIPLDKFHVSRRLARDVKRDKFTVRVDTAFEAVITACAEPAEPVSERGSTWINDTIIEIFTELFALKIAHCVECWHGETLVGGLYGLSLGGVFFGESMFSAQRDASKIALVHLVARLQSGGYKLLDTQFVTDHLKTFGATEISRAAYKRELARALTHEGDFYSLPVDVSGANVMQLITQTS